MHFSSFSTVLNQIRLLVAFLTAGWALLHVGVAAFAALVCPVLAETFDFAGALLMALLAVFQGFLVGLVVKLDAFFHFDYVAGKCGSCKSYHGNHCY